MSDKCEFCGEELVDGACLNPECDLSDLAPASLDQADLSEDTFLPDLDFDDDDLDLEDQYLPELSEEGGLEEFRPAISSELEAPPELSDEQRVAPTLESAPEIATEMAPELGDLPSGFSPALSSDDFGSGPFLSLEQAAIPIDHTGTVMFEGHRGPMHTHDEVLPDENATRLTDDENYRVIKTVLGDSVSSVADDPPGEQNKVETGKVKGSLTGRPEISRTIRVQNPAETHRTLHRLPSRDLSVPSDSASLEKRKRQREEDTYSLDSKDYEILDKAGEGGSGVVYKARQIALKRTVAVKVLKQRRMKGGSRSRTRTKELEKRKNRFLHEVHITARLQHPNIIPLYDLGINPHGEVFYSMKLIDESSDAGDEVQQSWASMVRIPPLQNTTAQIEKNVAIFDKVCDAMRYAHAEKIVHRDLKPDNVMVGQFGEVLVIDWGMALDLSEGPQPFTAGGTTSYMPPEMGLHYLKQSEIHKLSHKLMLALGEARRDLYVESVLDRGTGFAVQELLDDPTSSDAVREICERMLVLEAEEQELAAMVNCSSDIYLLGAILYEIAVGHPPHFVPQDSCKSIEEKHHREFWLSSNHKIQRLIQIKDPLRLSLCNIALKALRRKQEDRYQSVDELKEAIRGFNKQVQAWALIATGRESLEKARGGEGYMHLLPALESFRGAQSLWPEGEDAKRLQTETACEYARRADSRKDFDAGLSILNEYTAGEKRDDGKVVQLKSKLEKGKRIAQRNRRLAAIGWLAAVILPIGVFVAALFGTAQLRETIADLDKQADQAKVDIENAQLAKAEAEKDAVDAQQKAEAAKTAFELAQQQIQDAEKAKNELTVQVNQAKADIAKAEEDTQKAQKLASEAQTKAELAQAEVKKAEAEKARLAGEVEKAEATKAQAEMLAQRAEQQKLDAQRQVDQIRATSSEDQFKAKILPIPLDVRKNNLQAARQRLKELRESELSPQFKNGWVAAHFAKVVNVSGVENQLGENSTIIDVMHGPNDQLIVIGREAGQPTVWQTNSETGESSKLNVELPGHSSIAGGAVSPDGKWLGLALDDVNDGESFGEHYWIIDLASGRRAWVPDDDQANQSVIGCKLIGFSQKDNRLNLVTLEERSSYHGLKQRLQVVTRPMELQQDRLTIGSPVATTIDSTRRDQGRVQSIAALNEVDGVLTVVMAYESLNRNGGERIVLESLVAGPDGKFTGKATTIASYPTAIHVSQNGKFYCGYADGRVSEFKVVDQAPQLMKFETEHESPVTILTSSPDGKVVSGSRDGVMIVFDERLNVIKRLVGQSDALTTVSVADTGAPGGFQLVSGGSEGYVRIWNPDATLHDAAIRVEPELEIDPNAKIRLGGTHSVTCGAIDRQATGSDVPATAYGLSDGRVFYFDPEMMRNNGEGIEIKPGLEASRVNISPPPGSFDATFDDFDSFGIVGDRFVLLQEDGKLFSTQIDRSNDQPSSSLDLIDPADGRELDRGFLPLLAAQPELGYFFTTDPENRSRILSWTVVDSSLKFQPAAVAGRGGRIKRMSLSPDGNWLAVVREAAGRNATGEYITEIYEVQQEDAQVDVELSNRTDQYRVGDPAFVGFSKDSQEIVLHFHKLGVDRETWIENWNWDGQSWKQIDDKEQLDNRKVDLLAWDGDKMVVTKINKRFFLTNTETMERREIGRQAEFGVNQNRLRSVRPTGIGQSQYVLFNQSLERFDATGARDVSVMEREFNNARDVRVFGNHAVVLDDEGFHLVNADLDYVTLIARRKIATQALELAGDRLVICYDVGGLCRVMDVSSGEPAEVGRFDGASQIALSPNGRWVACRKENVLEVYDVSSRFNEPVSQSPIESDAWAMQWIGMEQPMLLVGIQVEGGQMNWREFNPETLETVVSARQLPAKLGDSQSLAGFELATRTEKYLACILKEGEANQLSLWGIAPDRPAVQLDETTGLDASAVNPISISFSEPAADELDHVGTRLVVLSEPVESGGASARSNRIFLLTDDLESEPEQKVYRVFEIEGVIEVTDGRELVDSSFSGDGGTLLEVDQRGVKILLSKDW